MTRATEGSDPITEGDWEAATAAEIEPDIMAAGGVDPETGRLDKYIEQIGYGQHYDASLKDMYQLVVLDKDATGGDSTGNLMAKTSEYIARIASFAGIQEHQVGVRVLLQELILTPNTGDYSDVSESLGGFRDWVGSNRSRGTYGWHVASKFGLIGASGGTIGIAYVSAISGGSGVSVNRPGYTVALVAHETGHNQGSGHSSGGIMNSGLIGGTRDYYTDVSEGRTAAKAIYDVTKDRIAGSAAMRHAAQIPWANDDARSTAAGAAHTFNPLNNDAASVRHGSNNSVLKLEEVGRVWPLWAGEAAIDGDQIVFTPEPGYQGIAYFSYTLRGDVGNGGQGWLHKGDVSVKVGSFNANSLDLELGAGQHFSFRPSGGDPDIRTQPAQAWVGTSRDDRRLIIIHADATATGTDSFVFRQDGADKTVNITYRGDYFQARPDFIVADPTAGAIRLNPMLNDQAAGYRNYASTYPVVGANSGGAQTNAYYFRREFPALNTAAITGLTIELLRDDGAVIYLNGTEVARDNMPAGPVDYATEASAAVGGGDESAYQTINIGAGALVEGTNLIAVEVHQAGAASSDLGFDLALKAARSGGGGTETLIARNSRWRYYQDGDEPAADWETAGCSAMAAARQTSATVPISSNKYPTTYFRAKFTPVIPAAAITGATLRIRRDDGAVVYLNGAEIARDNMPSGAIAHTTFAAGTASDDGDDWHEFSVAPAAILAGENVIAAEVHQASGTSSDITFDCELIAQTAGGDVALIPAGAEWRYLDDGSNQGTAWRGAGFADAAWATGPAPLGYPFSTGGWDQGDGVLGFGDDHIDTGLNKGGGGERYFPGAFEFISATNLSTDKGSLSLESRRFVLDRTPTDVLTGGMTFTPNANATGVATIEYTVRDASGETQTNTVSIILPLCEITSPAADPVAVDLGNGLILEGVAFGGGQAPLSGVVDLEWSLASAPAGGQVIFDDATAARTGARVTKAGTYVLRLTGSDSGYATEDEVTVQVASRGLGAPGDSLFGWWRFDDTNTSDPADSSGNNRPGSRQDFPSNTAGWGDGIVGGALTFDPNNTEYVRLRMYSDDLQPLAEGALSVWFRTNTGSDRTIFGASSTAGNPRDLRLYVEGGKLRFQMRGIGGIDETPLSSGSDVNDNNWHHAAAVAQSDGLVRLFLDGNEVAAGVRGFFADVGGLDRAAIGRTTEGGTGVSYFRGQLDDLRLYTRPLSRAEIEAIANSSGAGAPVVVLPNATPTAPGATFNLGLLGAQIADSDPVSAHWAVAGGPGAASFSNAASLGSNVTFTAVGDYTLRLEADDGTAASFDDITITYTGQGSAFPVALGIEDRIVPQDGAAEQVDLFAAFEDASTPDSGLVFSVVGNTNPALFSAIQVVPGSPARLSLAFSGPEGSADLTVRAADAQGNATDTTFTVTVQNFAPQIAAQSFVVAENPEVGTVVGTVRAADPDGDAVRYLIVGGNEAGVFALDANTGSLSVARAAPLNFELNESFALTVAAIDAANLDLGNTATITVHVTDLAEPPLIADQSFTVFEGTPIGTDLGAVIASDPDGSGALTFSVVGGDIGAAGIIADTGVLWLATGSLDVEAKPRYNIVVRARDESGLTADATVHVTVARKLVAEGANARYRIPANDAEDAIWRAASFNDSAWALGAMGIGYDEESDYDGEIQTDVEPAMAGVNETIYLRIPFSLAQPAAFGSLRLRVKYDDGFVAYLNGTEIARRNAAGALGWDAGASANHADGDAVQFEEIEADAFAPALVAGQNVLAIHGLNAGLGSSDFLLSAELIATGGGTAAAPNPPAAQIVDASQITPTTARLRGEVASDGGGAPVQVTIAWGLDDAVLVAGVVGARRLGGSRRRRGTYVADAASLAPDTDYFFRSSPERRMASARGGHVFRTAALPERVLLTASGLRRPAPGCRIRRLMRLVGRAFWLR
ncbi:MAG: cadherin domain-containing protein [Verrucomicrobiales bacterium]